MRGQTDRQRAIPVVDGGVGDDGHVGGELAPEPEDGQKNKHLSCCRSKSKSSPDENTDVNNVGVTCNQNLIDLVRLNLESQEEFHD